MSLKVLHHIGSTDPKSFDWQGVSKETAEKLALTKCTHSHHEYIFLFGEVRHTEKPEYCIDSRTIKLINIKDDYYANAYRYPNGHLIYYKTKRELSEK